MKTYKLKFIFADYNFFISVCRATVFYLRGPLKFIVLRRVNFCLANIVKVFIIFQNEKILSFVPPDGNFRLMSYHIGTNK